MCANPECDVAKVFARGLCSGCYTRLRRGGTLERKNMRNTGVCSEPDCGKPAFAKNFCKMHYDRNRHPLVTPWKLLRSRNPGEFPVSWDNFEIFLTDVGDRPTPKHQLRRLNPEEPYSASNIQWLEPVVLPDYYTPEQRSVYERAWRFQKRYGITIEDYDRMLVSQGGRCAICRCEPTQIHQKSGKVRDLAVDHDHVTGLVRSLLCTDCNTMLGLAGDLADRLRAAGFRWLALGIE